MKISLSVANQVSDHGSDTLYGFSFDSLVKTRKDDIRKNQDDIYLSWVEEYIIEIPDNYKLTTAGTLYWDIADGSVACPQHDSEVGGFVPDSLARSVDIIPLCVK